MVITRPGAFKTRVFFTYTFVKRRQRTTVSLILRLARARGSHVGNSLEGAAALDALAHQPAELLEQRKTSFLLRWLQSRCIAG